MKDGKQTRICQIGSPHLIELRFSSKYINDFYLFLSGKTVDSSKFVNGIQEKEINIFHISGSVSLLSYLNAGKYSWRNFSNCLGKESDGSDALVLIDEHINSVFDYFESWKVLARKKVEEFNRNELINNNLTPTENTKLLQNTGIFSVPNDTDSSKKKIIRSRSFSI